MRIKLDGGAYQAASLVAAAQSCINLIPERVPQSSGEPVTAVHRQTPGLLNLGTIGSGVFRCIYYATTGGLYVCVGNTIWSVLTLPSVTVVSIGTIGTSTGPVAMSDNGVDMIIVDGTATGYNYHFGGAFTTIVAAAFYGGCTVACLDGYFALPRPNTSQFYLSSSVNPPGSFGATVTWPALYIASSITADILVSLIACRRELWIFGRTRTEIWTDTGAADFPLSPISGGIEYGCVAAASPCQADGLVFWLSQSRSGQGIVMQGENYQAKRISTHAIERAINTYSTIADAVGWTYQIEGHTVYVLTFPTANATWCYDVSTQLWHQWSSGGGRHRGICGGYSALGGFQYNLVGDYANGNLYVLQPTTYQDNGQTITRTRRFPHLVDDQDDRIVYKQFICDMQTGSGGTLSLRWSDDRGSTWSTPITQSMGSDPITSMSFRRLGMARDRIFEVSWSTNADIALLGAFVETDKSST